MKWTAQRAGGAGLFLLLALLIWDSSRHIEKSSVPTEEPSSYFEQDLEGLGVLKTSFQGELNLVHEKRTPLPGGGFSRTPVVGVTGRDPEFSESTMLLPDSLVTCWSDLSNELLCKIESSRGRIPMQTSSANLAVNSEVPWVFEQAVISFPQKTGAESTLKTPTLQVEPELRRFSSDSPFQFSSGNLSLEGTGFQFEPSKRIGHWGLSGLLSWTLTDSEGHQWKGTLAGPATMKPGAENLDTIQFSVSGQSTIVFPDYFSQAGTIQGNELFLLLSETPRGWQPLEASFSNNCQILTEGSENHFSEMLAASARFNWSEDKINGLALRGPVSFSNGPTLRWGVADGGLWLEPGGSGYAWGGIAGYLRNGFFSAATCEFSNEQASLRGPVQFANGTGGCDLLIVDTAGNAKMEGNASLQLEDDFHLQADRVLREIQVEGKSETVTATGNVFAKFQSREGVAATLRANHLVYSPDWHYTKEPGFQAEGKIQLEQGQTKFLGRSFRFQKNGRAQLVGWPASGKIQTQNGLLRISSERILLDNEWVFPSGNPKLVLPAPDLGLTGKDISISSKRMSYNLETTSWELLGDVRFLGGLRGRAQKVIGRPEAFEFFPGALGFCVLSGTLKEGDKFYLKAKNIKAFPDGHLRLYGNAKAVIGASDSDSLELEGREAMFTQNGGWMKSHVLVKFGTISGQANEVSWNRLESGDHSVTLLGAAHLSDPETKAGGQEIRYKTAGPSIYVLGKRGELASISFSDGGTATGEWLQFDLANRLLSGEGGTLIKP